MKIQKVNKRCLECPQARQLDKLKQAIFKIILGFDPKAGETDQRTCREMVPTNDESPTPRETVSATATIWGHKPLPRAVFAARLLDFWRQRTETDTQGSVLYAEFACYWQLNHPCDLLPSNTRFGRGLSDLVRGGELTGLVKRKTSGLIFYHRGHDER